MRTGKVRRVNGGISRWMRQGLLVRREGSDQNSKLRVTKGHWGKLHRAEILHALTQNFFIFLYRPAQPSRVIKTPVMSDPHAIQEHVIGLTLLALKPYQQSIYSNL